ncbi:MAG: DNA-binding domain-containing protein, partial [Bradyrhizobium sp.]|nr:DNA-binding domain-containing protein [Bradyrhizobium sp.]
MSELERLQAEFQRSILGQDSAVLEHVMDGPREQRDVLFGVYKNGYASRLTEVLRKDHEYLHAYLGDEMFDQMSKLYIAEHPSQQPNLRWFSRELPDLLRTAPPFAEYPEIADLAALE